MKVKVSMGIDDIINVELSFDEYVELLSSIEDAITHRKTNLNIWKDQPKINEFDLKRIEIFRNLLTSLQQREWEKDEKY